MKRLIFLFLFALTAMCSIGQTHYINATIEKIDLKTNICVVKGDCKYYTWLQSDDGYDLIKFTYRNTTETYRVLRRPNGIFLISNTKYLGNNVQDSLWITNKNNTFKRLPNKKFTVQFIVDSYKYIIQEK